MLLTCLVCFSKAVSFSIAPWTFVYSMCQLRKWLKEHAAYLSELLSFRKLLVNFLGEILVRLENLTFRHGGVVL